MDENQEYDYDKERETPPVDWYDEYGHKPSDFYEHSNPPL